VESLCVAFLDLQRARCALDGARTLAILEGRGVGPSIQAFLKKTQDGNALASKQAGFCSKPFDVRQGARHGDADSPVIFNVVVDAVIQDVEARSFEELATTAQLFHANDGVITDNEPEKVQKLAQQQITHTAREPSNQLSNRSLMLRFCKGASWDCPSSTKPKNVLHSLT
jgi:hypothetical protein